MSEESIRETFEKAQEATSDEPGSVEWAKHLIEQSETKFTSPDADVNAVAYDPLYLQAAAICLVEDPAFFEHLRLKLKHHRVRVKNWDEQVQRHIRRHQAEERQRAAAASRRSSSNATSNGHANGNDEPLSDDVFKELDRLWAKLDSEPGLVIRLSDAKITTVKRFEDAVSHIQLLDLKGKKLNAGAEWLNSPTPHTVAGAIFLPHPLGQVPTPDYTEVFDGKLFYNHWRGWVTTPASEVDNEALRIYFDVRDWLFGDQPEVVNWMERWIAHKLLRPDVKQPNVPILIGWQGCGKDSLARFYGGLFGEHTQHIPGSRLTSKFNAFLGYRLLVTVGELEDAAPAFIKDLVSNKLEMIEPKFVDATTRPSYLQLIASTNERIPYLLKADDRRGGIFRACRGKDSKAARIDTSKIDKLEKLIADPKRYAGIYPYFTRLDLTSYNPFAEPEHTSDKDDLIHMHRPDAEQFIVEVIENLDEGWINFDGTPREGDLAAVQDFAHLRGAPLSLRKLMEDKYGLTTIGKWLAQIFPRGTVNGGKLVRTSFGRRRLWPLRNADKWYGATPSAIAEHYNGPNESEDDADDSYLEIAIDDVVNFTERAVLVAIAGKQHWIPLSQVQGEVDANTRSLRVSVWCLKEKGLRDLAKAGKSPEEDTTFH